MKTYNEMIQKLANLPSWAEAIRRELCAEQLAELKTVTNILTAEELNSLAIDLSNWARSFDGQSLARPDLGQNIIDLVTKVSDNLNTREMIALFLLLMDAKDGKAIAKKAMATTN